MKIQKTNLIIKEIFNGNKLFIKELLSFNNIKIVYYGD